jgi:hypothetical protein
VGTTVSVVLTAASIVETTGFFDVLGRLLAAVSFSPLNLLETFLLRRLFRCLYAVLACFGNAGFQECS